MTIASGKRMTNQPASLAKGSCPTFDSGLKEASDPTRLAQEPLVSVLMITFNHEAYLAQAIEGVISQECPFPFELIIGEDASIDRTRSIALDYQKRFPEIVRVLFSAANVGVKANSDRVLARARGKFVAYCEGDDYWCSPLKLARQVELIKTNPDIGIVHTDWVRSRLIGQDWSVAWNKAVHQRIPRRWLEGRIFATFHYPKILRTCTVLITREAAIEIASYPLSMKDYGFSDTVRAAYVTSKWRVGYLPEITAVYRLSPNSLLRSGKKARIAFLKASLDFDTDARVYFADRSDYPRSYRWEMSVGLLLWAISARDADAARFALRDIRSHFGLAEFIAAGWRTLIMRLPTLRRQPRSLPPAGGKRTGLAPAQRP